MDKIAIITDSCADVPKEYVEKYDIYVIPMMVQGQDREYKDGIEITAEKVYELQKNQLFRTSTPTGNDVIDTFDKVKKAGYNKAIVITLASGLSGTFNQLRLLTDDVDDLEVAVIDGKSGSAGYGIMAITLAEYRDNGATFDELKDMAQYFVENGYAFFAIDTLEHLARGGRIGKATAFVGGMMNIKPILSFEKEVGEIYVPTKMRERKGLQGKLIELIDAKVKEHANEEFTIAIVQGGIPEEGSNLKKAFEEKYPNMKEIVVTELGAALATYLGKGLLGAVIIFHKNNRGSFGIK